MCDLRMTAHETIPDFISSRFDELTLKRLQARTNSTLQNMTVRLPKGQVAAIDMVAEALDMSRQEFLFELMGAALDQALVETSRRMGDAGKPWLKTALDTWAAPDFALEEEFNHE